MTENAPPHARLYEELVHRIRAGVWQAGDRVPSEKALIAEFRTAREPLRQALAALRAEGMIVGGRGTPPRVQRVAPPQSFDTFISFTEWAHELGLAPGQRIIEAGRRTATEEMARELQIPPDSPVVEIIRLRLLDGKPAMLERSLFPQTVGRHLLDVDLDHVGIYQALCEAGFAPVRARHVIDAIGAHPLEAENLGVTAGAPLLRVRRVSHNEFGTVLEAADDRYLPSTATFVVENSTERRTPLTRSTQAAAPELFEARI